MPGPMPYYLEKGPAMSVLEDFVNTPSPRLATALDRLRARHPDGRPKHRVVDCGAFDTPALSFTQPSSDPGQPGTKWDSEKWKRHMNRHWFGLIDRAGHHYDPAQATSITEAKSWWVNYFGADVEGIVRETLIRAVETAYRIDHGGPLPPNGSVEPWPIELFWKCGQAWFEGWVTWRQLPGPGHRGLVTTLLCTPAEDTGTRFLWWSPIPDPSDLPGLGDPYDKGVQQLGVHHAGMVVITHERNLPTFASPSDIDDEQMGRLQPPRPGAVYHGSGPVVVVRPAEVRGGVASTPRRWTPEP